MKNLILLGANGAIGSTLITEALKNFNHIYAIDKKFNKSINSTQVTLITLDILDPNAGKNILSKITNKKYNFYIGFAQRPFVNIMPDKLTDDIVDAVKVSLISSLDIFEYLHKTLKIHSVFFLGSINSSLVCDQPLSYMIAKSSCDTAVKFISKKFPNIIFINFILGLVNFDKKEDNFSTNQFKRKAAFASIGIKNIPDIKELSKTIIKILLNSNQIMSGNEIYLDSGQHHTDSYWSARISSS